MNAEGLEWNQIWLSLSSGLPCPSVISSHHGLPCRIQAHGCSWLFRHHSQQQPSPLCLRSSSRNNASVFWALRNYVWIEEEAELWGCCLGEGVPPVHLFVFVVHQHSPDPEGLGSDYTCLTLHESRKLSLRGKSLGIMSSRKGSSLGDKDI